MRTTKPDPLRAGLMLLIAMALALGAWVLLDERSGHQTDQIRPDAVQVARIIAPSPGETVPISTRELKEYYKRRVYLGSPPRIPHKIDETAGEMDDCMGCHEEGEYDSEMKKYAPVTPHPTFVNCVQCHIRVRKVKPFGGSNSWASVKPPPLGKPALFGGPPPIPHSLQLRETCVACHTGNWSVKQIRTSHPKRINCVQCHVERRNVKLFVRKLK